jgi:ethanolamine utilization protein EutJ
MDANQDSLPVRDVECFLREVERTLDNPVKPERGESLRVGLDLGTASIVLVALGENCRPLAVVREFSQVVKDGLVVDFNKARMITTSLKSQMEGILGVELTETAIAVPPGTGSRDVATHGYVASAAGLEVTNVLDEPVAANLVLGIRDGAIADIGGGTTGVSILKDGELIYSFDEPTGGTHVSLVIAGHNRISFEEAEAMKQEPARSKEILPVIAPVLQKIGSIIGKGIAAYECGEIVLVGGTSSIAGIDRIIGMETGKKVTVSPVPILVTPVGIAMANNREQVTGNR